MSVAPHDREAGTYRTRRARSRGYEPGSRPALVAVDLGAGSCRVSLLRWMDDRADIQLAHRFLNAPVREKGTLRWDMQRICDGVEDGLRVCAELAPEGIAAIGVDGWAVDYVRLDAQGHPTENPFCYRDQRTAASQKEVHACISADRLYGLTGIQILPINTLYQLYADGRQDSAWVNLPEFVLQHLGAERVAEYTNATHTALLSIQNEAWSPEIFAAAGLDLKSAPRVVRSGTDIGRVKGRLAELPAFRNTRLIAPACHDTASAIAGISAQGDDWAFISSGTWSLVGRVLDSPCVSPQAMRSNFSNEGGVGGKINFLKIVNGMWLLQQCMEDWQACGQTRTFDQLLKECEVLPPPPCILDVDDPELLQPGDMPGRIHAQLERRGLAPISQDPDRTPEVANLIFHSLAARYAEVLREVASITGRPLKRIYVVGGGSRNTLLNRLTEKATGLKVLAGCSESATVGNFAIQLAALAGEYTKSVGVTASAVAGWTDVLTGQAAKPEKVQMRSARGGGISSVRKAKAVR